jgi:hypothetical protein
MAVDRRPAQAGCFTGLPDTEAKLGRLDGSGGHCIAPFGGERATSYAYIFERATTFGSRKLARFCGKTYSLSFLFIAAPRCHPGSGTTHFQCLFVAFKFVLFASAPLKLH